MAIKPSIDAIAEVRVQTNMYTAETGRTLGGVINIITKSGGNEFHGSAFEFARNEKFDSRLFFAQGKPQTRQNQFGGSLGGPMRVERTFFFVDYDGYRLTQGVPIVVTVPTAKMRSGDFSELSAQIYDPLNALRTPFAGNVIPASRFDPIAVKYMQLYPHADRPWAGQQLRVYERAHAGQRCDRRAHRPPLQRRNTVFARYSYNKTDTLTPSLCPPTVIGDKTIDPTCIVGGAATGNYAGPNYTTAHNVTGSYVRILNATTIMEVKGSYSKPDILSLGPNNNKNLRRFLRRAQCQHGCSGDERLAPDGMRPTTIAALGETQWVPLQIYNRTKQFAGSVTKTRGAHNLKIGGGVIMRSFGVLQSNSAQGLWGFDSAATDSGATGAGGNAIASFLLGYPTDVRRLHTPIMPHYHTQRAERVRAGRLARHLVADRQPRRPLRRLHAVHRGGQSAVELRPSQGKLLVAGQDGVGRHAGVKTDYSNIGPRFGFSATSAAPDGAARRLRAGLLPEQQERRRFMKNPPFSANYGPVNEQCRVGGVPNMFLKDGLPPVVFANPAQPTGNVIGTDVNFKSDRSQQFNLMLEKEFAGNVVTAGYVGYRAAIG